MTEFAGQNGGAADERRFQENYSRVLNEARANVTIAERRVQEARFLPFMKRHQALRAAKKDHEKTLDKLGLVESLGGLRLRSSSFGYSIWGTLNNTSLHLYSGFRAGEGPVGIEEKIPTFSGKIGDKELTEDEAREFIRRFLPPLQRIYRGDEIV